MKNSKKLRLQVNILLAYFLRFDFYEIREHKFTMINHQNDSKCRGLCQIVLDCTVMMDRAQRWLHSDANPTRIAHICCHGEGFIFQSGFIQPWKVILHVLLQVFAYGVKICSTTCYWFYSLTNEEPLTIGKEPNFTISYLHVVHYSYIILTSLFFTLKHGKYCL